jgi:hypothetical protein
MRCHVGRVVASFLLISCLVLPAAAAPRRDDRDSSLWNRIVQIVKTVIALEDAKPNWPIG